MQKLVVDLQDDFAGKIVSSEGDSEQKDQSISTKATLPLQINLLLVTFADLDDTGSVDLIFFYEF